MASFEEISEVSDYTSVSTSEMEIQQHQMEETESSEIPEELFEEPVRSVSPVMWRGMRTTAQQQRIQPAAPLPLSSSHRERGEFQSHRMPRHLQGVKSERWVGTHNNGAFINPIEGLVERCLDVEISYMEAYREQAPTTGHVHYHSIVILPIAQNAFTVFVIDPHANWQPMRGRLTQAYKYMIKDGQRAFLYGERPRILEQFLSRNNPRQATPSQIRFNEIVERAKNGDESIRDEMIYARYQRYFDQILIAAFIPVTYEGELSTKNLWIYGPPGTGKSRMVHEYAAGAGLRIFNKLQNKWWDGFSGHQIVLIEDADPEVMHKLAAHMKVWSDRYPFCAEKKGTAQHINPTFHLVVTSNYSIDDCFNEVDARAMKRRFDVLEMF